MRHLVFALGTVCVLGNLAFGQGRLVAIADDWPIGEPYTSSNNGGIFVRSALNWMTAETTNKNVLFDGFMYQNQWWGPLTQLKNTLQAAGYTVTASNVSNWDSQTLSNYGAVIWAGSTSAGIGQRLVNFSSNVGNILYIGGLYGSSNTEENTLLNTFGIHDAGVHSDNRAYCTNYTSHPCVAGVSSLWFGGSTNLQLMAGFGGEVVGTINYSYGSNAVIAVPEPVSMMLVGLGGMALLRRRK
jgi:hypothetical protein